jgi:Tol biopolymer transport system component
MNLDGTGRRLVAPQLGDEEGDPAWSRDGRAVAYFIRNSDSVEIHVLRPQTGARRVITSDFRSPAAPRRQLAYILQPDWAPDGRQLVVSDSYSLVNAVIRVVSMAGRWRLLTTPSQDRADKAPAWSPDGRTIAFVRQRVGGDDGATPIGGPAIFLIGEDGQGLRRLTDGRSPSWSPDSRSLVYAFGDGIYRIGADGRGRTRIIGGLKVPVVRWSRDGRMLLYTTRAGGATEIWVARADGSDRKRVLRAAYVNGIAWQPAAR